MKKIAILAAALALLPLTSEAGLTYTPVGAKAPGKLTALAVLCVPRKGERPEITDKQDDAVTLICKPQTIHIRGLAANKVNASLLWQGKGLSAAVHVYKLHYRYTPAAHTPIFQEDK